MDTSGNYIRNQFCNYEIALKLKELGFDEPCLAYFEDKELMHGMLNNLGKRRYLVSPLYQQAFRWFRLKHNLVSWIYCPNESKGYFAIILKDKRFVSYNEQFDTYEEAELACLNKLIEIVKNEYNS